MNKDIFVSQYVFLEIDTMHWSLGIKLLEINPDEYGWCIGCSILCFHLHIGVL